MIKIHRAMIFLEKHKHLEPNMSEGFQDLVKKLIETVKEQMLITGGLVDRSMNSSQGFLDGISGLNI